MKFELYSDLKQLPESVNELFSKAANHSVFYSRPWFESITSSHPEGEQSYILACVVSGHKFMALLPLIKSTETTCSAIRHRYTPHFSLLLDDDNQEQVLACLAQGLIKLNLKGVLLEPIASDDENLNAMKQVMEGFGYHCEYHFRHYNWIYRVEGQSFANYMAMRPAKLRNTIARKQRKLQREHGYDIRLFCGNAVPAAMVDYYSVYNASWKANEQYVDLVDDLVKRFSNEGWTRLAVLYINETAVAAQLWFVHHGKASIFRLSYDEAWKAYSPGTILMAYLMEYVIDIDKVEEIDFLTGNDAYKQDWMSERRECFALSCVNSAKTKGQIGNFIQSLSRILKR